MPAQNQDAAASGGEIAHSPIALLVADTDATQAYVFESNKLPEIRGASRWLDDLNQEIGRNLARAGHDVIYVGGGSLLALIPSTPTVGKQLVEEIENLYPQATGAATITAAWRPLPSDGDNHLSFGETVGWAGHWLRRRKESKEAPPFYEALPFQTRCQSCQLRPADARLSFPDWALCPVCHDKRTYERRDYWFNEATLQLQQPGMTYFQGTANQVEIPLTLEELAETSRGRSGYVAFLYLDGDRIGRRLTSIPDRASYTAFSRALSSVTRQVVFEAIAAHLSPRTTKGDSFREQMGRASEVGRDFLIHPFEIIAIGGDDVMLIVPADVGLSIASQIGQQFTAQLEALGWPGVTISGGVLIAPQTTPIRIMRDLAAALQKQAKQAGGGRLDFHLLKSADMLDRRLSHMRGRYPYTLAHLGTGDKHLRLLGRPYMHAQIAALWQNLIELKRTGFASSQMQQLAAALLTSRHESTLFYLYQQARHQTAYAPLDAILDSLQSLTATDPPPWQSIEDEEYSHQTVLWDLAELFEFIP